MNHYSRMALWANSVQRDCLLEANGDVEAALQAAEYIVTTQPIPEEWAIINPKAIESSAVLSIDAFFAHDIFNRQAQGILNRSLKAAKGLSSAARKELESALKHNVSGNGEAILKFIEKYRLQLAKLLTATQLAAVLEGAREVAKNLPVLANFPGAVPYPALLEPKEAAALVKQLSSLTGDERARTIYNLPADQQTYIQQALAAKEAGGASLPPIISTIPSGDVPGGVHFPTIDEAVKALSEKNVMTRDRFDALDAAARAKAFTVANVDAQDTLTKIRDALAENVREGASYEAFKQNVMEDVAPNTFMSEAHLENVFRTNVQTAFSDGQATVLSHPLVRSGFPYSVYDSIHDDRVREEHRELDSLGISGTNIYRTDDPVFKTFRPPWSWNCRCSWTPITVRHAAEKGIEEAKRWLASGVEPSPPAFVPMPDFAPPPGFRRAVSSAPMSVQLSMQPMATFAIHDVSGEARDDSGKWSKTGSSGKTVWKYSDELPDHDSWKDLEPEEGYVYHATNKDNAGEIQSSSMKPHRPWHGTQQSIWPDGSTERRIYLSNKPSTAWQFAPEGHPALLRIKSNKSFKKESTGDLYLEGKKIPPHSIEILTKDGWKPLAEKSTALSTDDLGHEHRGKGPHGGEFTGKGEGGSTGEQEHKEKGAKARVHAILKRAAQVNVVDEVVDSGDTEVESNDFDEIQVRMNVRQRRLMEDHLQDLASSSGDDLNFDADEHELARSLNVTRDDIEEKAEEMFAAYELKAPPVSRRAYGVRAIEEIIKGLPDDAPDELKEELDNWVSTTEREWDEARDEEEQQQRDEYVRQYDDAEDRRAYLRQFYEDNEELFTASPAEFLSNTWYKDRDGNGVLQFETESGNNYKVKARYVSIAGQAIPDMQFSDASGSYIVTGAGEASQVFSSVVPAMVAYLQKKDLNAAKFSAAEPSRQRLYDRLVKTVASIIPNYFASYYDRGGTRYYLIGKSKIKKELISAIEDMIGGETPRTLVEGSDDGH